ncbi:MULTISPECIES: hydrogenase maturation nickel metallochaperone HypA [Nitrospira]|uniref:Hydrogenase maturation factor HypA n=2 Tax=Nitrospira TaxID=1234 RepID=A0AA86TBR6_9BACT|nr:MULTISPECIES: hydrogenase maturation nickel metallochaperone HypA [Nitrospira]CAE6784182.1 Hydrogenase maturation factor HypA [Nitrospira defluvii]CAI4031594.1 Hydrogenase maturation factor HypA [Nitrospira tepida]
MHELSITRNIVAIVNERARGAKVTQVTLEIGQLSPVIPDAIRFCFDVVAKGTLLEGAQLEVIEVPGHGQCRDCGRDVELRHLVARCSCGSSNLVRLSGEELNIKQMVTA